MTPIVSESTRGKNFLDLTFTNGDIFGSASVLENTINDHSSIYWPIFLSCFAPNEVNDNASGINDDYLGSYNFASKNVDWDIIN